MKKLKYLLLLFIIFLITDVNAEVINGSASIASGVIYDGSYGFTPNITLQDNNENVYRYSSDYVDPFIMGSRYVAGVNLGSTGANSFSGVVQIPVAIYSLNNVTLYNRVSASNFHIGLSNTFYDWNLTPTVTNFRSNCSVYYNTTTSSPYNICLYTINFTANSSSMIYGGTNFSFSLYDWDTPSNLVFQPLGGSWGNNYGGWIFPKNPTNIEGASNIAPTFILSYGNNVSETLLEQQIQQQQTIINQNQTIINQQNQNTNSIINNQDNNTQDIIDNQNANTDKEIESQKVCNIFTVDKNNVVSTGSVLGNDGNLTSTTITNLGVTDFILINDDSTITVLSNNTSYSNRLCFYSENKNVISCLSSNNFTIGNIVTIPNNSKYIRATIVLNQNSPSYSIKTCQNGNQALSDDLNNLNDTLNSDTPPDTENQLNDLESDLISDTPITDLITLPISLLNSYITGFSGSCSPVNLGNLLGTDIIFPCLNLEQRLGSNLWQTIDSLFSIFMIYNIAMLMIQAFEGFTSLRDDYEGLYQPRHADTGYQPKHGGGN